MDKDKLKHAHSLTIEELLEVTNTDSKAGLSDEEYRVRLKQFGKNRIKKKEQKSLFQLFLSQINTPISYLLALAAVLSFIFGDIPEGTAIVVVLLINAAIGFWMEYQAQKSIEALKEMDKIDAQVVRSGDKKLVDAEDLVPGDLVELGEGQIVPADLRLIYEAELHVNESSLTGESFPVKKNIEEISKETRLPDRSNMMYKGTGVTRGKGTAIATGTGMETEIGNVSKMITDDDDEILLNQKLGELSKKLIWIILGLAFIMAVLGYFTNQGFYNVVQIAIAWTIAAIPEGLPIVASIALARGMLRLADKDVLVKQLGLVETLGETNIILTDKTGTLTEDHLTVAKVMVDHKAFKVDQTDLNALDIEDQQAAKLNRVVEIGTLCNDSQFDPTNEHNGDNEGDPLETALLRFSHEYDPKGFKTLREMKRVAEDPFDGQSKMMGIVYQSEQGYLLTAKGATEVLLELSSHNFDHEKMDQDEKQKWLDRNDELAREGYRVLAFGYNEMDEKPEGDDFMPNQKIIFVGLIGFLDPPRKEVKDTILNFERAGIDVVMVTGDHSGTARAIADSIAIAQGANSTGINGDKLDSISTEDLLSERIFARVNPAQKLDILKHFQNAGNIVGMTGDGVNDAPALKKANIGISMGQRGTQTAKEVSDVILKNDLFNSILDAIKEGRIIFGNIRKFILYQLSYHLSEIVVIAAVSFSLFQLALLPLQLLFLNILLDVFPALALGLGQGRAHVMTKPPKKRDEPIVNKALWLKIFIYGFVIAGAVCGVYFYGHFQLGYTEIKSNNIAFFTLAGAQLLHIFNMIDTDENIFKNQVTKNKYVWFALLLCIVALCAAYLIPDLSNLLALEHLDRQAWALIAVGSASSLVINQIINKVFKGYF